jgi:RNase H-fold protein (predicted Holliday junction resolvase)
LTFGRNLDTALAAQAIEIPYVFVDESLTTHAARDVLIGRGGAQNAEDQLAACQLLADFIRPS